MIFNIARLVLKTVIFAEDLPRRIEAAHREAEHNRRMRDDATYRDEHNRQLAETSRRIVQENRRRGRLRGLCWFWWLTGMVPFLVLVYKYEIGSQSGSESYDVNYGYGAADIFIHAGEFGFAMWLITRVVLLFLKY